MNTESTNNSWIIAGGRVIDPSTGTDGIRDIYVENGIISNSRRAGSTSTPALDARGFVVTPGLIDLHVHFREPGNIAAETIESGSAAAAKGGFTTVVTMPNTTPATDNAEIIRLVRAKALAAGKTTVLPSGCITKGRSGREMAGLSAMAEAGAVAFTDDGSTVTDYELMAEAMTVAAGLGIVVMDHALDPVLAGRGAMHECAKSAAAGLIGIPSAAETTIVERDVRLAEQTGCRMHIQHISCAGSVELIRQARKKGLPVSGEASPHHLTFCDADIDTLDADYKMNPPLRSAADREAIIAGVLDGTLEAFATDHAPHCASEKARGFAQAPFGIIGLETAVGATYSLLVRSGRLSLTEWLKRWTTGPAAIIRAKPPSLAAGSSADIAILDLNTPWTVNTAEFLSKSTNTPFKGMRLTGRAVFTLLNGRLVWNGRN